uniref:Transmembrane 4 L six family member 4 n=2 Tax=Seriola dumerili TaxID=41447 RepID=A0A3B4UTH8_SERDU
MATVSTHLDLYLKLASGWTLHSRVNTLQETDERRKSSRCPSRFNYQRLLATTRHITRQKINRIGLSTSDRLLAYRLSLAQLGRGNTEQRMTDHIDRLMLSENITDEVWYFGGILGSGVLMIFPALVFLGLKNNDCCGCCGNESCGRRFAMLSSLLFAAVGVLGGGYSVIVSAVAINYGPRCLVVIDGTEQWGTPFLDGSYLSNTSLWSECLKPDGVVSWHLSLFSVLLVMGVIQVALCAVQVVNGLLGALCGDCCRCNEQHHRHDHTHDHRHH